MASTTLPPEVIARIVHFALPTSLPSICLSSKSFLAPAQARLFSTMQLGDPSTTYHMCTLLATRPHLARLIKTLWIFVDQRRINHRGALPRQYWLAVRHALEQAAELDMLALYDSVFANTWVLNPANIPFQLTEANLKLTFDAHLARFLESQTSLKVLHLANHEEPSDLPVLAPDALSELYMYEGPTFVAVQMTSSPLTHVQALLGNTPDRTLPQFLAAIPNWKGLRNLNLMHLPIGESAGDFNAEAVSMVATYAPKLFHLGIIPIPCVNRNSFHRAISRFHCLRVLELDLSGWNPTPPVFFLRALASELHTYCAEVQLIAFWIPPRRYTWQLDLDTGDWACCQHPSAVEGLWKQP